MDETPLTVAELIEILKTFDQALPVYCCDLDTDWEIPITTETRFDRKSVRLKEDGTKLLIEAAGY